jgi:hypothetical protein
MVNADIQQIQHDIDWASPHYATVDDIKDIADERRRGIALGFSEKTIDVIMVLEEDETPQEVLDHAYSFYGSLNVAVKNSVVLEPDVAREIWEERIKEQQRRRKF